MDFALYILIAIALYKWWKWRRSSIENRRFIKVQARIIQDQKLVIESANELVGILKMRRDMERDVKPLPIRKYLNQRGTPPIEDVLDAQLIE